ncbi:MAG: hypothetical protein KDB25_05705 [Leucobacter sp.]|nr:hypothetical protein [Leucobacter sp.]
MRLRTGSAALDAALAPLGDAEGAIEDGLVFAPRTGLTTWEEAEAELQDAFRLSQAAMIAEAPVIYVLHADAVLGRGPILDAGVADALVGGARALAFEGKRRGRYAAVVGIDPTETPETLGELSRTVDYLTGTRAAIGQVLMLTDQHLGAMLP